MKCDKCSSERVLRVGGKTSDMFSASGEEAGPNGEYDGYVPTDIGIATHDDYGDYINFRYCLDCGKIQGEFPISKTRVAKAFKDA